MTSPPVAPGMRPDTKFAWLTALTAALALLALLGGALSVHLVWIGANPAPGAGSLGHVGTVIAGVIVGSASVVCALLGLYTGLRARAIDRAR